MKSSLLKLLLFKPKKNRGFLLPVVMGIGLIMTLLASVNIVRSSQESTLAVSKKQSSDALAMAEIGVTRYREFLNRNRILALHNRDRWTNVAAVCDSDVSNQADTTSSGWKDIEVQDINDIDDDSDTTELITIGQYQIVDYEAFYDTDNDGEFNLDTLTGETKIDVNTDDVISPDEFDQTDDNNNNNPIGVLTVKGRSRTGNETVGEAQIRVTIPLGINTEDFNNLAPAIWLIDGSSIRNDSTMTVNGNIVITDPYVSGNTSGCRDNITNRFTNEVADPRTPPPLITLPTGIDWDDVEQLPQRARDDSRFNNNKLILGRPSDDSLKEVAESLGITPEPGWENIYYYRVANTGSNNGNFVIFNGEKIITDGTAKVIISVENSLVIRGDVDITNSSNSATSRYLELHVGNHVVIRDGGTVNIKALINVPNVNKVFQVRDGSTVDIVGSVWAYRWRNISSSNNITITPDDYKFYSTTSQRTPQPLTYRPTGWETQEVN